MSNRRQSRALNHLAPQIANKRISLDRVAVDDQEVVPVSERLMGGL